MQALYWNPEWAAPWSKARGVPNDDDLKAGAERLSNKASGTGDTRVAAGLKVPVSLY